MVSIGKTLSTGELVSPSRTVVASAVAIAFTTFAVFASSLRNDFVGFDDPIYVTGNPHVQAGLTWAGARWAFTAGYAGNWHPLTWLSHMLDAQLFGASPVGPHAVNTLLHATNAALALVLLWKLTNALGRSVCVAAFFALHPLRVESVAWVSERKDTLSALFFLLTLLAWTAYQKRIRERNAGGWYGAALALFACGLMCKPSIVTLPCVLLLLDLWPFGRVTPQAITRTEGLRSAGSLLLEKAPFFLLSAVSSAVTVVVQRQAGALDETMALTTRIANALAAYAGYFAKTVWPFDLAAPYPAFGDIPRATNVAGALLLVTAVGLAIVHRRRTPGITVGLLWFLGMLVPTIGLAPLSDQAMADRYTYLPSIGLLIAVAWAINRPSRSTDTQQAGDRFGVERVVPHAPVRFGQTGRLRKSVGGVAPARWGQRAVPLNAFRRIFPQSSIGYWPRPVGIAAAIVLGLCVARTVDQIRYWENSETLSRRALAVTQGNFVALNNLGVVLLEQGKTNEAIECLRTAIAIKPSYPEARVNLGDALMRQGNVADAIAEFERALELRPADANAHFNLANTLASAGKASAAVGHYQRAVELQPAAAALRTNYGNTLASMGRVDEAVVHYRAALALQPELAMARHNLGVALRALGHWGEAVEQFRTIAAQQPDQAAPQNNFGWMLLQAGRYDEAVGPLETALRLRPDYAEAHSNLGRVRLKRGQGREAVAEFRRAVTLAPNDPVNLADLAWALAVCPDDAVRDGREALVLARRAAALIGDSDAAVLRALAAAEAENGNFAAAITQAEKAIELSTAKSDERGVTDARIQREVYRAGAPFREFASRGQAQAKAL